ncbi:MAG: FAD-dependent oxidoreductase [Candidatus Melainabacteria bacterium]|nr:FAD-dependent oxidoreductase [Candidatus Melainabacteria bacterium]
MAAQHNRAQSSLTEVVDVQGINADRPFDAIRKVPTSKPTQVVKCDILIVGGGTGGVAAALAATKAKNGSVKVCMTEETDWIGGQMTAQGVSALDENYLVETSGACRSYQDVRRDIRDFYSSSRKLSAIGASKKYLDPGNCWVSRLAFEPKVCLDVLKKRLEPAESNGKLATYLRYKPIYATCKSDNHGRKTVHAIGMINLDSSEITEFEANVFIDATELGELLPLCQMEYASGSDSASSTNEPHAPAKGDVENVQDFVFPFVVEYRSGQHHVIDKPKFYDEFNSKGKFSLQGWKMFESALRKNEDGTESELLPLWTYRRLIDKDFFDDPNYPVDVSMINWDSNDLRGENIIDKTASVQSERLARAKYLSLGFLYWLQTEADRDEGGKGYPELMLRKDVLATHDGLSKFPYIRESRRIKPIQQITEQDIVASANDLPRSTAFDDTVGIGLYPVDIHGHQEVPGAAQQTSPFQISLSSLIPGDATNLLPACKNIGVTHITNGAYRLHPIEWAIGEVQGALAAQMCKDKREAKDYIKDFKRLRKLQMELVEHGTPIYWFDDVATDHTNFAAIQFVAATKIFQGSVEELSFRPNDPITEEETCLAIGKILPNEKFKTVDGSKQLTKALLRQLCEAGKQIVKNIPGEETDFVTRSQFAQELYRISSK